MIPTEIRVTGHATHPSRSRYNRENEVRSSSFLSSQRRVAFLGFAFLANQAVRSTFLRISFLLCFFSLLLAGAPERAPLHSQAQTQATPPPLRVPLIVSAERAALPVVVGVPMAESSALTDASGLGVVTSSDEVV